MDSARRWPEKLQTGPTPDEFHRSRAADAVKAKHLRYADGQHFRARFRHRFPLAMAVDFISTMAAKPSFNATVLDPFSGQRNTTAIRHLDAKELIARFSGWDVRSRLPETVNQLQSGGRKVLELSVRITHNWEEPRSATATK